MKIPTKILGPIVLLVLGSAGSILWVLSELNRQHHQLEATQEQMERSHSIALRLSESHRGIREDLLSYRFQKKQAYLNSVLRSGIDMARLVDEYSRILTLEEGHELLKRFIQSRKGIEATQAELIRAIQEGAQVHTQLVFDKWSIQTDKIDASLLDLTTFTAMELDRTLIGVDRTRNRLSFTVVSCGVGALLLLGAMGIYLSRGVSRRLSALTRSAREISGGNLRARITDSATNDEIGMLAKAFTDMTESLEQLTSQNENIVASIPSGLLLLAVRPNREESTVLSVNRSFGELFDIRSEEVVGKRVGEVLRRIGVEEDVRKTVLRDEPVLDVECRCSCPNGRELVLTVRTTAMRVAAAEEEELLLVVEDITKRKRAEEALRMRDRALAATSNGVLITDSRQPDNPIVYCNAGFERLTGYSFDEIVGGNCRFLQNDDHDQEGLEEIRAAVKDGRVGKAVIRNYRKDGSLFWNELTISPVHDEDGQLTHFIGVENDVTARKQAEERLRQSEQRLQYLISNCPATLYTGKPAGDYDTTFIGETITSQLGYEPCEFIDGSSFWANHVHPDDRERVFTGLSKLSEQGHQTYEYRFLHKNGTYRWMHDQRSLLPDSDGKPEEVVGFWIDITERKQAEDALRQSEARLVEAERIGRIGHWDWNVVTNQSHLSDEFCRIFGIEPSESGLTLDAFLDIVHPDDRENVRSGTAAALDKHDRLTFEYRIVRPDGDERVIKSDSSITRGQDGHPLRMFGVVQDITDRKQAEQALRVSEARLDAFFSSAPVGMVLFDDQLRYLKINETMANVNGLPANDYLGNTVDEVVPKIAPFVTPMFRRILETGEPVLNVEVSGELPAEPGITRHWISSNFRIPGDDPGTWAIGTTVVEVTDLKRAEQELKTLNETLEQRVAEEVLRFETLLANLPGAAYRYRNDPNWTPEFVSAGHLALTGYTNDEVYSGQVVIGDMMHPEDRERVWATVQKALADKRRFQIECRIRCKSGETKWVWEQGIGIYSDDNEAHFLEGFITDITERKAAEDALRKSEQELSDFFDNATVGLHCVGPDGIVLRANQAELELLGYSRDEYVGRKIAEFHVDQDVIEDILTKLSEHETIRNRQARLRCKDGTIKHVLIDSNVLWENGKFIHTRCFTRDITDRKRAEEELRMKEHAIHSSVTGFAYGTLEGKLTYANPAFLRMWGYEDENEVIGRRNTEFASDLAKVQGIMEAVRSHGHWTGTDIARRKDGTFFHIDLSVAVVTDSDGKAVGTMATFVDVSGRIRAEEALRESEQQLRAILNTAADAIITIGEDGTIISVNAAAEQTFGYTSDEMTGQNVKILMPSPYRDEHDSYLARYLETREPRIIGIGREVVAQHKDGSTFPVDLAVSEVDDLGLFTGIIRDITDRKGAEEALRSEHELSESIIDTSRNIVMVLDTNGCIVRFNPYMEELTGWRLDEVKGRDWFDIFLSEHDRERIRDLFGDAIRGQRTRGTVNAILTTDGREREVEWYDAPLTNDEGQLIGLLCTGQDITERRILEREILDISAEEQRRIGSDLHDGVCQELTGLGMLAQGLVDTLSDENATQSLEDAGLLHLHDVTRRLSAGLGKATKHTRDLSHGLMPVDVDAQGLMAALRELASSIDALHDISCTFDHDCPIELFDNFAATHLYRIVQEAVGNALKHSQAKHIRVAFDENDDQVVLSVTDDGVGIPDGSESNGMGLRIMKYRADLIGASLNVESEACGGTTVWCQCAMRRAIIHLTKRRSPVMSTPLSKKRILIVDDHAMIRDGLTFQLSRHQDLEICGEAESVDDAFALVKETRPDLVIVDISLKEGHGIELIKKIKQHDGKIKMLVSTMYNESLYAERSLRAGAQGYLNKQESREKMVEAVRAVLSGQRYLSPQMTERLVGQAVGRVDVAHSSPVETLSNRELEVFQLIGEGVTTGAIARKLHLSPHTIDTHREKIKTKLGLKNGGELQREAVQWVLENG